jgi:3-oxoacyl-[acyl-carrier-protein] synthase-3
MNISFIGTGHYLPEIIQSNSQFEKSEFIDENGKAFEADNKEIIEKFQAITGIESRRYLEPHLNTSDMGFFAAQKAIENAKISAEESDYIIFAHNFGDVRHGEIQTDLLPSLASRVKNKLGIQNPKCVAYDMIFGCPGWVEGIIQAKAFIKSGMAKNCLVIGAEALSRVVDINDRDSMIFADGAGATIVSATNDGGNILANVTTTLANDEAYYLYFGKGNKASDKDQTRYIKMLGRKVYELAVVHVPSAMAEAIEEAGVSIAEVKKVFLHQANEKMDEAMVKRLYRKFKANAPDGVMPMNIKEVGNNSVATVPVLFDMVRRNQMPDHELNKGDVILFASVGAGMNLNCIVYRY